MVTAKKASVAKTSAAAPAKTVAAKKTTEKKELKTSANADVPATTPKAAAKPKAPAKPKLQESTPSLSEQQRKHYVQVAAFYIAERRGFAPGDPAADWAAAEIEVDRLIASGQFN